MNIAVVSGKGGTGKTLVATSIALSRTDCTYVDLDVEEPNGFIFMQPHIEDETPYTVQVPQINKEKCSFCGACANACQYNAITVLPGLKDTMIFPELCHSCGACTYVCQQEGAIFEKPRQIGSVRTGYNGSRGFIEGRLDIGQPSGVPLIRGILGQYLSNNELYILDSAPGTSCPVVETIKKSDYVILVSEPTPFGASDLELTIQLVQDLGKSNLAGLIINKDSDPPNLIDDIASKYNLPVLLRIPYSMEIQRNYAKGVPFTMLKPEMKQQFNRLLHHIESQFAVPNATSNQKHGDRHA